MLIKEIAKKNNFDLDLFLKYLTSERGVEDKKNLAKYEIDDSQVGSVVEGFKDYLGRAEAEKAALEARKKQMEIDKKRLLSEMLVSSGFTFDGYRIVKYSGYISGDDAVLVQKHVNRVDYGSGAVTGIVTAVANSGRSKEDRNNFENFAQNTTEAFVKIRRQALKELKEAAYDLDCNAVIGVDFDYVTIDTEYDKVDYSLVCVTANGTACVIEPINDK